MANPIHGPGCYTTESYPLDCPYCGQSVHYWSCNHGSKVFFDSKRGGKHLCKGWYEGMRKLDDLMKRHYDHYKVPDHSATYKCKICDESRTKGDNREKFFSWSGLLFHFEENHIADLSLILRSKPSDWKRF